jgi:hypothetical protein
MGNRLSSKPCEFKNAAVDAIVAEFVRNIFAKPFASHSNESN